MRKRFLSFVMALALCLSLLPAGVLAANSYKINGVTVSLETYNTSSPGQCWAYASRLYKDIWGTTFSNSFDEASNSLRNLSDSDLVLTEEHLKTYVTNAALGSVLRVTTKAYLHEGDSSGHSQIIVQKDDKGFTVLEGGLSAAPYCREHYYTWSEFVSTHWLGAKYGYIKYIKWPDAPAYTPDHTHKFIPKVTPATCVSQGYTTYTCSCGQSYVEDYVAVGDHSWVDGVCTVCGKELHINRIYGAGRCETAIEAADTLKARLNRTSFDTILIASGSNFADALAGSYLATIRSAPILLYRGDASIALNREYILANLSDGGTVYLLGGSSAVPEAVAEDLTAAGVTVKRLAGPDRYATNLAILQEAGIRPGQEVLISTAYNFADSLSASATGLPILLVGSGLSAQQENYLKGLRVSRLTILGGRGAVSEAVAEQLQTYGEVRRLAGTDRYDTSALIARTFFKNVDTVAVAYGKNFPDGLAGGPLAYAVDAPLLLTHAGSEFAAVLYVAEQNVTRAYILGGPAAVSDSTVNAIFDP